MKVFECRLCRGSLSEPKLNLGSTPLANEFVKEPIKQDMFPLEVCVCETCGHYQLNETVDPERLFRNYLFVAGTSPVNIEHFRKYAAHMVEKFDLKPGSKVLDIASNDGVLLQHFKDLGMTVLGIDPAKNIAEIANKSGIETIPEFFTETYADEMLAKYGQFNLITANNVFAHVPDMIGFAKGVKKLLAPNGVFSFEVSYFYDVCKKILFDTIYHEHSSLHSVEPLVSFFRSHDMEVFDVERISNHGGSIRVFVRVPSQDYLRDEPCRELIDQERQFLASKVEALGQKINALGIELNKKLRTIKDQSKSIAIYGVPAKATTLLYSLNIDEKMIDFACDDAPLKQDTLMPGKHIPVLPTNVIYERKPDVLLILAWNFAAPIMKAHPNFKGTWIVPIPELKEYHT
jgi:SAM-dependent methyltransferase